jgi:hypothetical protein
MRKLWTLESVEPRTEREIEEDDLGCRQTEEDLLGPAPDIDGLTEEEWRYIQEDLA